MAGRREIAYTNGAEIKQGMFSLAISRCHRLVYTRKEQGAEEFGDAKTDHVNEI